MRVVFLAPTFPPEMIEYTRGLKEIGCEVYGVGDTPKEALSPMLKKCMSAYLQVPRIMDEKDVAERVTQWLAGRSVDRIVSNWEPLTILAARLREIHGLPGMSVDDVIGFRDKQVMKERVKAAGLRVPKSKRVFTESDIREAVEEIGYPVVLKPIAGAGSADTYKVQDAQQLDEVMKLMKHVREASCEEYIVGEEYTYDTLSVGGVPVYENSAQYLPKPLEARSNEWISPVIITVRDMQQPKLQAGIQLGRNVLKALRMGDGFTHMEWFLTPKGEAIFGEIGCRPPGGHLVDQMNYTGDIDLFREWARVVTYRRFEASTERKYNCGIVFKRAMGQGRITRITGLADWKREAGSAFVGDALSRPGTMRRNWKNTLLSDGHVLCRHADWDEAYRLSFLAATNIALYAE
jgi:biotin carboxylase